MPAPGSRRNARYIIALGLLSALILTCLLASSSRGAPEEETGEWIPCPNLASNEFLSNTITALESDERGRLWVGTNVGLAWTDNDGRSWNMADLVHATPVGDEPSSQPLTRADTIARNKITSIEAGSRGVWVGTLHGLCLLDAEQEAGPNLGAQSAPGPEIWGITEHNGNLWVSARNGIHHSTDNGTTWKKIPQRFPPELSSITLIPQDNGIACWLAGFDAPKRAGGGPDILYSEDDGRHWSSTKSQTASEVSSAVSAHVNRLARAGGLFWACTRNGLARSRTLGKTWYRVRRVSGLEAEEVFDITEMWGRLWLGTSTGLFSSTDNGRTWQRDTHIWCPVRKLVQHDRYLWLATSGGLLRRARGGEVQTFSVRRNVLSLATTKDRSGETWWAGTTGGLCYTRDKGKSWRTLTVNDGLPSNLILSLDTDGERVWAGTDGGIWSGTEGGRVSRRYGIEQGLRGLTVYDIHRTGMEVYAATDRGLCLMDESENTWRTFLPTKSWHSVWIMDGTIYGAVMDPEDPMDGMDLIRGNTREENWETLTLTGQDGAPIHQLAEVGGELWAATDNGLFRSRDEGTTWARFTTESLWASRITRMARGENNLLCVQAVPNDPPSMSGTAFLNVTQDNGRSWRTLTGDIPGHANAVMVNDNQVIIGTRLGVSYYSNFNQDCRVGQNGRLTWYRIAALAASTSRYDRLGHVSCVDRYAAHGPSIWLGSMGMGAIERGNPTLGPLYPAWDITGQIPRNISEFAALPGKQILAIADSPDGLWFGTASDLFMYDRLSSWTSWKPDPNGLMDVPIRALTTRGREIWIGTDKGLSVFDFPNNTWTSYDTSNSPLPDNRITTLNCDGEKIWGGTAHGGFMLDSDGAWKVFIEDEAISSVALGSARKYFSTQRGIFSFDNDGAFRKRWHSGNTLLRDDNVLKVFVDGPDIWAATAKGIRKILHDRAEPAAFPELRPSRRDPSGVLVVVNQLSPDSLRIGQAYQNLRGIPPENVCAIRCTTSEAINRSTYEEKIRKPIWRHLRDTGIANQISFIVTTSGVPLRIAPEPGESRRSPDRATQASVDSELTLLSQDHPLRGGITNLYIHREETFDSNRFGMYLVTRLDGPTPEAAIALAERAVEAEKNGRYAQTGFARFDTYPVDERERETHRLVQRMNDAIESNYREMRRLNRLHGRVTAPERTLRSYTRPGTGHNTFFFIGHGEPDYTPGVFSWTEGAIGVCLEPRSASTLRNAQKSWVAGAVQAGVTASIGTVYDPGERVTVVPNHLYHYLRLGFAWAEAAYMSLPNLSSQVVVIGDPLYTPLH